MKIIQEANKLTLILDLEDNYESITEGGLEKFGLYFYTSKHDGHLYIYDKTRDLVFFFSDNDNNIVDDLALDLLLIDGITMDGERFDYTEEPTETMWEAIVAEWALDQDEEILACEA